MDVDDQKDIKSDNDKSQEAEIQTKIGTMRDGKIAILRSISKDGRPTLEIYDPVNKSSTKIRYNS